MWFDSNCPSRHARHADTSHELHLASLERNKLLSRAVTVITNLQSDTDKLIAAADLHHEDGSSTQSATIPKMLEGAPFASSKLSSAPIITIPSRFKATAAGTANSEHAYQRTMHTAAQQRNALLKRAYDVISNLQV